MEKEYTFGEVVRHFKRINNFYYSFCFGWPSSIGAILSVGFGITGCFFAVLFLLFILTVDATPLYLGVWMLLCPAVLLVIGYRCTYSSLKRFDQVERPRLDAKYLNGNWKFDRKGFFDFCERHKIEKDAVNWREVRQYLIEKMTKDMVPLDYRDYYLSEEFLKKVYFEEKEIVDEKKSIDFYKECVGKGVSESTLDDSGFRALARNKGLDLEKAKEMFLRGAEINKKELIEKDNKEFETNKTAALSATEEIYLAPIYKKYEELKTRKEALKQSVDIAQRMAVHSANPGTSNAALWGGIANGLGGLGAGLTTAYEIEKKNEQLRQRADIMSASWQMLSSKSIRAEVSLGTAMSFLEEHIERVKNAVVDADDQQAKTEQIGFEVQSYRLMPNGFMELHIKTNYNKSDIQLFGKTAIADGSVKVRVLKNDRLVGEAYIVNEYTYDEAAKCSSSLGFRKEYLVYAKPRYGEFDENTEYIFEFCPIYVWHMEKYKECFDIRL